jgi:aspartate racemase
MRIAGMIGGLGPETTVDYYRLTLARYRERKPNSGYPQIVINSLDVDRGIAMLDAGRLDELTDYLVEGVGALSRAGAEFGFLAANTPHMWKASLPWPARVQSSASWPPIRRTSCMARCRSGRRSRC